ncbi:MAG: DNA mismatch repair endonuclease MutL [Oscillospiraceae bacterium]|nr:DNA mismatch repair endonuclease MutL [Oscillospiraceae bacterium]
MGIINVLDFRVANLIAAGEVVDRPASVIKELMENSIDAGAMTITVEVRGGGISLMRVTDDGKGMTADDVPVAISRHATSKIRDASDLDGILTLGFRGEALAAISSVCKMKIITKTASEDTGTLMVSDGGVISEILPTGTNDGTTVICEELFMNVPARRKFLKSNITETAAITSVVEKIALSRPDISIKYIIDNEEKFSTTGDGKLINTIYSVLGRDFAKKLIEVKSFTEGIEITGYIGRPDYVRGNRNYQNFFINNRYVKSKTAMAALEQAFNSFIPSDKFPACLLEIKIHPAYVDVNVHPAKLEVKFSDEKTVFNAIYCAVRDALLNKVKRPEMEFNRDDVTTHTVSDVNLLNAFVNPPEKKKEIRDYFKAPDIAYEEIVPPSPPEIEYKPDVLPEVKPQPVSVKEKPAQEKLELPQYKIIGETFYSYVLIELSDRMVMIDKHAAHERIIFEEMRANMKRSDKPNQILLIPIEIKLNAEELAAVSDYEKEIKAIGYDYNVSGETLAITQYPAEINSAAVSEMVTTLIGNLSAGTGTADNSRDVIYEKALYQASCKAAVKAGQDDKKDHLKWICEKVLTEPNVKYCPHGRPVAFELTKRDIERQFKR